MKVTVTGSLGNISRVLVEKLVAIGHEVKVISSDAKKANEIEKTGAIPLIGSLADVEFVSESFKNADAVYTMVPPDFSVEDYYSFSELIHNNYAKAVERNNIRFVVNLSSTGVELAGVGPMARYFNLEKTLNSISNLNIVHLRPAMFYTNFYGSLAMIKQQGIIGHNLAENVDIPMTHPSDIADLAFTFLNSLNFSVSQIKYVISDVKNGAEIALFMSKAIGKTIKWVEYADEALMAGLLQNGFSRNAAETVIVNVGKAIREGLFDDYKKEKYKLSESRKFEYFVSELSVLLKQTVQH
jgi:uncharacterized protein YbjT (DUF2867 family)